MQARPTGYVLVARSDFRLDFRDKEGFTDHQGA